MLFEGDRATDRNIGNFLKVYLTLSQASKLSLKPDNSLTQVD